MIACDVSPVAMFWLKDEGAKIPSICLRPINVFGRDGVSRECAIENCHKVAVWYGMAFIVWYCKAFHAPLKTTTRLWYGKVWYGMV